jgi:CheY-like chemotaxis protein
MPDSTDRKWKPLRNDLDSPGEKEVEETPVPVESFSPRWYGPPGEMNPPEPDAVEDEVPSGTGEEVGEQGPTPPEESAPRRVLIVQSNAATTRLIRETLENFTEAEVVTTSDPLRGFELALQKEYRLFVFGMLVGELSGPMLYELISKTYSSGWAPARLAPGVIFIRDAEDPKLPDELSRDVRVKDTIQKPVRIDRLLRAIQPSIEVLDPTSRT